MTRNRRTSPRLDRRGGFLCPPADETLDQLTPRGLRLVVASILLFLPLLAGFALEAAAQTVPKITITRGAEHVTEGTAVSFTLTANPAPTSDLPVKILISDAPGTVLPKSEWDNRERMVTIPANTATTTFTVATEDDNIAERFSKVFAHVRSGSGYTATLPREVKTFVLDNDAPDPRVIVGHESHTRTYRVAEGRQLNIPVRIDFPRPLSSTTVGITCPNGTASGADYSCPSTVIIPAERRSANLSIQIAADTVVESEETFSVQISSVPPGVRIGGHAGVTILDDGPTVTVVPDSGTVTEGEDAAFTVRANPAPKQDLTVDLTVIENTSEFYGDFVAPGDEGAKTVTIPAGKTSASYTVATDNDSMDETDGRVRLRVDADATRYAVGRMSSATVTIVDNDGGALLPQRSPQRFAQVAYNGFDSVIRLLVPPGVGGLPWPQSAVHFRVTTPEDPVRNGGYVCDDGSRVLWQEFTSQGLRTIVHTRNLPSSGYVEVPVKLCPGSVGQKFQVVWDSSIDPNTNRRYRRFNRLAPNCGAGNTTGTRCWTSVTVVSKDDLPPPVVSVAAGNDIAEGEDASYTLTATPAPFSALTVNLMVAEAADSDFVATADEGDKTVTIPTTGTATYTVATTGDRVYETDGSVTVTVVADDADPMTYTPGDPSSASIDVKDDETPDVSLNAATRSRTEDSGATEAGAELTIAATRALETALTVSYTLGGTATCGTDYTIAGATCNHDGTGTGTITLPSGAAAGEGVPIPIRMVNDHIADNGETIILTLASGSGYGLGNPSATTVTIYQNTGEASYSIQGEPHTGATLTIQRDQSDPEGDGGDMDRSYSWASKAALTDPVWTDIAGETGNNLVVGAGLLHHHLRAEVSYVDGNGLATTVQTASVGPVTEPPPLPVLRIATATPVITEGEPAVFTVTSDRALPPGESLIIHRSIADTPEAASDFLDETNANVSANGVWVFSFIASDSGATARRFEIPTVCDTTTEPSGNITVKLRPRSGEYTVVNPATAMVMVNDGGNCGTRTATTPRPAFGAGSIADQTWARGQEIAPLPFPQATGGAGNPDLYPDPRRRHRASCMTPAHTD